MNLRNLAGFVLVWLGIVAGIAGGVTGRDGFVIVCAICVVGVWHGLARSERGE